jgi:hypothetical protein
MISTVQGTFLQRKFAQGAIFRRGITHGGAGAWWGSVRGSFCVSGGKLVTHSPRTAAPAGRYQIWHQNGRRRHADRRWHSRQRGWRIWRGGANFAAVLRGSGRKWQRRRSYKMMRGAAESKRNRVVLVSFRPKRYNTMSYKGCSEMLRSCGKFLEGGRVSNTNSNSAC